MPEPPGAVRNISDTALWAAYFRANESKRPDALYRDPYAEKLAGARGAQIANTLPDGNKHNWAWVTRTYLFDQFISQEIENGTELVVNLAAGLDARPYRTPLNPSLQWVEVDLPDILAYKQEILAKDTPKCRLERIALDLSDIDGRKDLFAALNQRASRITVIAEGLLIYLAADEVSSLARDLAANQHFQAWILDIASPGLLKMMQKSAGKTLTEVGAPFRFGPPEGPEFFVPYGWCPETVEGLLKVASRFKRPPFFLRLLSKLPESKGQQNDRPWSGVCVLRRRQS